MPEIIRTHSELLPMDINGTMNIPAMLFPSFRLARARERKVDRNILIVTQGGLGDIICAEPAIRYALNTFKNCKVSVATDYPDLFSHLPLHELRNTTQEKVNFDDYLVFDSLYTCEVLHSEFMAHPFMHVVDHHTLLMFRSQIAMKDKCIQLVPSEKCEELARKLIKPETDIIIHPGKTWQSRTVPKWFWDLVIHEIKQRGFRPVLIGKDAFDTRSTVPVETEGCYNLRNKLSLMETVACLHRGKVLLSNDSSPIHMAASGPCWIGVISTVKFPEFITHYRDGGQFGWRQKNFSKGGMWQHIDMCPNMESTIRFEHFDQVIIDSWMPDPVEYVEWAINRLRE